MYEKESLSEALHTRNIKIIKNNCNTMPLTNLLNLLGIECVIPLATLPFISAENNNDLLQALATDEPELFNNLSKPQNSIVLSNKLNAKLLLFLEKNRKLIDVRKLISFMFFAISQHSKSVSPDLLSTLAKVLDNSNFPNIFFLDTNNNILAVIPQEMADDFFGRENKKKTLAQQKLKNFNSMLGAKVPYLYLFSNFYDLKQIFNTTSDLWNIFIAKIVAKYKELSNTSNPDDELILNKDLSTEKNMSHIQVYIAATLKEIIETYPQFINFDKLALLLAGKFYFLSDTGLKKDIFQSVLNFISKNTHVSLNLNDEETLKLSNKTIEKELKKLTVELKEPAKSASTIEEQKAIKTTTLKLVPAWELAHEFKNSHSQNFISKLDEKTNQALAYRKQEENLIDEDTTLSEDDKELKKALLFRNFADTLIQEFDLSLSPEAIEYFYLHDIFDIEDLNWLNKKDLINMFSRGSIKPIDIRTIYTQKKLSLNDILNGLTNMKISEDNSENSKENLLPRQLALIIDLFPETDVKSEASKAFLIKGLGISGKCNNTQKSNSTRTATAESISSDATKYIMNYTHKLKFMQLLDKNISKNITLDGHIVFKINLENQDEPLIIIEKLLDNRNGELTSSYGAATYILPESIYLEHITPEIKMSYTSDVNSEYYINTSKGFNRSALSTLSSNPNNKIKRFNHSKNWGANLIKFLGIHHNSQYTQDDIIEIEKALSEIENSREVSIH